MAKLTAVQKAEREELAKKYEQERRKEYDAVFAKIPEKVQDFLGDSYTAGKGRRSELYQTFYNGLESGKYKKPSDFIKKELKEMLGTLIPESMTESLFYSVDECRRCTFSFGYSRRPFRSSDYALYAEKIRNIIWHYAYCHHICKPYEQIVKGELTDGERACMEESPSFYTIEEDVTYCIDQGMPETIRYVSEVLSGGTDEAITYTMLRAVFASKNKELYELVGKLLLAARLQEGLRQAICENADCSDLEAFKYILKVIGENDLIRYSSVKRAIGTWTGLISTESADLDRISGKTLELVNGCLSDDAYLQECLASDDAMKVHMGLWALAVRDTADCEAQIENYCAKGTHPQLMATGYFLRELWSNKLCARIAKKMLLTHAEEPDLMALIIGALFSGGAPGYREFNAKQRFNENFESKEDADKVYDTLMAIYEKIPKKELEFSPCMFPWNTEKLTKSNVVRKLCFVAAATEDDDKIDTMCQKIPEIDLSGYGTRRTEIEMLLSDPKTDIQMDMLVSELSDREEYARGKAFMIAKEKKLQPRHYKMLEDMLRYKAADVREHVIELLMGQEDEALYECVKRLVSDKKEEKRTAGLDLIAQIGKDEARAELYKRTPELVELIEKPTSKEQILIDKLKESGEKQQQVYGYGFYTQDDQYVPQIDKDYAAECEKIYRKYFPASAVGGKAGKGKADFAEPLKALDVLIEQNKNYEFKNEWGEDCLLGNTRYFKEKTKDGEVKTVLAEVWDQFYEEQIKDVVLLERMDIATGFNPLFDLEYELFGNEFKETPTLAHGGHIISVLEYLVQKHIDETEMSKAAFALLYYIARRIREGQTVFLDTGSDGYWTYRYVKDGEVVETEHKIENLYTEPKVTLITQWFGRQYKDQFARAFSLNHILAESTGRFLLTEYERKKHPSHGQIRAYAEPDVENYIRAAYEGIISEGFMYKYMFEMTESFGNALAALSGITKSYHDSERKKMTRQNWGGWRSAGALRKLLHEDKPQITEENKPLVEYAVNTYEKLLKLVLDSELKRGDTAAEFSDDIRSIGRIYGVERFVQILTALGKDTLERSSYGGGNSKRASLSHLLGVCVPAEDDNAQKLGELLKNTDITEKRLVEAALYSPEWIDIVGEYLGWEGFRPACFYFMAHMNEQFDDVKKAMIARFTPIPTEELSDGAFDISWFTETYDIIGEKRFDMIYDAAKYISDGAKHSRARKYADAVLGRFDRDEALKSIKDKRNKDSLMAYALLPVQDEDDIFERYMLFKQFKKESASFGAQRRASESAASDMAMRNLALRAGYSDVTRLSLRMETKLFADIKPLTEPNPMGDVTIQLKVDVNGKTEIVCEKDGKALKSVPAKYKKDELNIKMGEVKKQLTEQYRRTRQMLEQAMEDRTVFLAKELEGLKENPVVSPLIARLVFLSGKHLGLFADMQLISADGKSNKLKPESELIVAHPLDLYTQGVWSDYQKMLFEKQIAQPFKQVFRELYVKTEDEKEAFTSLRYAGNQVQPAKTVSCLKTRRWVADVEDGLQKIYYKENIIARIYAMADWFSPADIESPTLEWVDFFDRKSGKQLCIKDIPDIIFSEVMRDVDLAVSVAHAGGVDPETSHSTIEMRRAICEFTMPLFKLDNVRFEKSHAFITGKRADYAIHLGSGVVHLQGGPMINVLPVHSQHKGKLFLPFVDEDPKTAQIISEIVLFAEDDKIKDPFILEQIK
ncbi:MAG: DUF4132 domain-containing protein [Lachnospiraceae bacterium]|nr:DUF4132 domain-containing protein [Lachnospiraceae bacterium]